MKGKICDWKDDKGFGFILPYHQLDKIFFHISDVKTKERRPKIADLVNFEVTQDSRQRLKAKNVVIEGLSSNQVNRVNYSNVEPQKKTILDYISIVVLLFSVGIGGFIFYQTRDLNKIAPFSISTIAALIIILRQKKPKEKKFTCARCKLIADFDKRTIQAWSKGMDKIYCTACHQQWLIDQSQKLTQNKGSTSGCLSIFTVIAILPMLTFISIYNWLS
jgi:cold shock CspA family protein